MTLRSLCKPEYLWRPTQLIQRFKLRNTHGYLSVRLPWGRQIKVFVDDNIGSQIAKLGVSDLCVTEALWRLCEPNEIAVDVGANIGYTMFVMAERIGHGAVIAFEPHPFLFKELQFNSEFYRQQRCDAKLQLVASALGREAGILPLFVPKDFNGHRGESSLSPSMNVDRSLQSINVRVDTLDSHFYGGPSIGVIKIDVEGFELDVLQGGEKMFQEHRIRDCVFEEHRPYPTPVTDWFQQRGYSVFRLDRTMTGPCLRSPSTTIPRNNWTATNYLSTIEPNRAKKLFKKNGWKCLG